MASFDTSTEAGGITAPASSAEEDGVLPCETDLSRAAGDGERAAASDWGDVSDFPAAAACARLGSNGFIRSDRVRMA